MLEISGLWKTYLSGKERVVAVREVSLRTERGKFHTLLGPSGCGKTTTLRCVAGLETPEAGEIKIDGEVVFSSKRGVFMPVHKREIAMVFQSYAIWPHMTVYGNIAFPLENQGLPKRVIREKVMDVLKLVGLEGFENRPSPLLSGGQQQRVALARAIVKGAKLLLFDEPLSNLDAKLRAQMRVELRELQQKLGITAIYVTHDQEEALTLSDTISVMKDGSIIEAGIPTDLYLQPQRAFTADFIGHGNLLSGFVESQEGDTVNVAAPWGVVQAKATGFQKGQPVFLLIRPEHVIIEEEGGTKGTNRFAGFVDSAVFTGRLVEYIIRLERETMRVHTVSGHIYQQGKQVSVYLPQEHCKIIS